MRLNFRKISALGASILLTGMTLGVAAAAAYPAPFVAGGSANVAIVYGTGAGVSQFDVVQAGNVQSDLQSYMGSSSSGSSTSVEGGDSVLLERSSDKLNLGDSASTVFVTSIDEDNMANLLAAGKYMDDDNTEYDYTQKITLGSNLGIEHFQDSDYMDNEPVIGIYMSGGEHVLNYTLDFTTNPDYNASTMETTTLNLMGKEYYVLDVVGYYDTGRTNKTTLLDSANSAMVTDGTPLTVDGKEVSISYISSTQVKLTVDGETTNLLSNGGTYKLSDGTYVGIKNILYDAKESGTSKVEVSIGSGKLELPHAGNIQINDVTIEEVVSFMNQDSTFNLDTIVLQWTTDDEAFIAPGTNLVMPGFESVEVSMGDFVTPKQETTIVENSGNDVIQLKTTLESGAVTIPLLKASATGEVVTIGKATDKRLVTSKTGYIFMNDTAGDTFFVASWNSTTEAESYYLEFDVTTEDNIAKARFKDLGVANSEWKSISNGSDVTFGSLVLTVNNLTDSGSSEWANISVNSGGDFQRLYTKEGLELFLPYYSLALNDVGKGALNYTNNNTESGIASIWVAQGIYNHTVSSGANSTAGYSGDSVYLQFAEEDKDSNLGKAYFNITIDESGTSNKLEVSDINTAASELDDLTDTDNKISYKISDLATRLFYTTGGDQDTVEITYAGTQAYAELYLIAPGASIVGGTTTAAGALGNVLVMDSEVSSVSSKNLIVVGGSCINSAAAALVGGAYCGAAWTESTSVGSGEYLIKGYDNSALAPNKLALLVAGYDATDTVNAASYLVNSKPDTISAWKGTSATSAEALVEAA